jgi:hypothetical protein
MAIRSDLGPLALGDVANDARNADHFPLFILDGRESQGNVHQAAILAAADRIETFDALSPFHLCH